MRAAHGKLEKWSAFVLGFLSLLKMCKSEGKKNPHLIEIVPSYNIISASSPSSVQSLEKQFQQCWAGAGNNQMWVILINTYTSENKQSPQNIQGVTADVKRVLCKCLRQETLTESGLNIHPVGKHAEHDEPKHSSCVKFTAACGFISTKLFIEPTWFCPPNNCNRPIWWH